MNSSMGLKNICLQCISHSEGNVILSILYFFGCPDRKREEPKAFGKRNRLNGMETDTGVLCLDALIDIS
jgi:hypothetical protein